MKVREIQKEFNLDLVAGEKGLDQDVIGGYCGDLLSDVMANSASGNIWLTIQSHKNILAVALLKEMSGIILVNGHQPDNETRVKADEEGIPILLSPASAYELAGALYSAGIREKTE